jgi:hypothetical protein
MKFSTEAVVALTVALVFALLSFGAIVREQGQSARSDHRVYIASNATANNTDVLSVY